MQHRNLLRPLRLLGASLLAALAVSTLALGQPRAEQFVLFDVMFDYTKMQADTSTPSKSHFYVKGNLINPARPTNWVSPVDYRNGTVHIRTEVLDKPAGGERTEWTLCYIPNRGQGNGYGCTGSGIYREKGLYERDESMTAWWENQSIIWTEGIKQMDLVIKDGSGGNGQAHQRPDHEKFFPTRVRITMVQVSAGSKYDASKVPNLTAAPADAGAPADASLPPDAAGGSGGTGGTPGTGGATGTAGAAGTPGEGSGSGGSAPGTGPGNGSGSPPAGPGAPGGGTGTGPTPEPGGAGGASGSANPGSSPTTPAPASGSGCSLASGGAGSPAGLLVLGLGLVLALGRPRRRGNKR